MIEPLRRSARLALLFALGACAHDRAAQRPAENPAPSPAHAEATTANEPGAAGQPKLAPEAQLAPTETIEGYMGEHFVIATWSRDAVINGRLDLLREPLAALAAYEYRDVAPGGWMPHIAQLQQAAGLAARAESLDAAAIAVATMARTCGECHAAAGRGPVFESSHRETRTPKSDSFEARMARHMWAADRLWEGLTGPSDDSWQAGASALAHAPARAPRSDPPLPPEYTAALAEVRELGQQALSASTPAERADVYGLFLASCAACHAHGVDHEF